MAVFAASRRLILRVGLVALALLALGWDLTRAPEKQLSAAALTASIDLYQATVSRGLDRVGVRCRFEPTCSHYARGVIVKHGALEGSYLAIRRVARCGPWTPTGTVDPP